MAEAANADAKATRNGRNGKCMPCWVGHDGLCCGKNLMKAVHFGVGFEASAKAVNNHVLNGGKAAQSPAEAAENAEFVTTMLSNGGIPCRAVIEVGDVARIMSTEAILIDMPTIRTAETDSTRKDLAARRIETLRPLLECRGDTNVEWGGPGTGSGMTSVNKPMPTSLDVLTAQKLIFSDAPGLDREMTISVMNGTAAGHGQMSTTYPVKVPRDDLTPAFMIDLGKMTPDIALAFCDELGVPLSLPTQATAVYAGAQEARQDAQDCIAICDSLHKNQCLAA